MVSLFEAIRENVFKIQNVVDLTLQCLGGILQSNMLLFLQQKTDIYMKKDKWRLSISLTSG